MPIKALLLYAAAVFFLYQLFTIGAPFLFALILASLLEPLVQLLMKRFSMRRAPAAALTCTLFVVVMSVAFYLLGAKMITELVAFAERVPAIVNETRALIKDALSGNGGIYKLLPPQLAQTAQESLSSGVDSVSNGLQRVMNIVSAIILGIAKTLPGLFISTLVFLVALFLISLGLDRLKTTFLNIFAGDTRPKIEQVLAKLKGAITGFIKAALVLSILTFFITLAGFLILGVNFPFAIALLIFFMDLIPLLATIYVLLPWSIYGFLTGDLTIGIGMIVIYLCITTVRRIVSPKVIGDAVGISAIAALVSIYVGFQLFGIVGFFLGPVVIILYRAMKQAGLLPYDIKL